MARFRIIVLDKDWSERQSFNIALWLDVPGARQPFFANAGAKSVWAQATVTDTNALTSGAVVERPIRYTLLAGQSIASQQAILEALWQAAQDDLTNFNAWTRYGTTWDGATWTLTGVA